MTAALRVIPGGLPPGTQPLHRRVDLGPVQPHARLILELASTVDDPIARAMVMHIDRVRELLIDGRIGPDDAHALLLDCSWLGRAAVSAVTLGMRAASARAGRA